MLRGFQKQYPDMFDKKGVFRNSAKFTRKRLVGFSFLKKFRSQDYNYMEKESPTQAYSCESFKIIKNSFFYRTSLVAAPV